MKTKFIGITTEDKDHRKLIRMRALAALNELVEDLPNFETLPYKEITPDDYLGSPYIVYTIAETDPVMQIRVTMSERYKVEFVYLEQGTGCTLTVTRMDWAQWLIDHLAEVGAN